CTGPARRRAGGPARPACEDGGEPAADDRRGGGALADRGGAGDGPFLAAGDLQRPRRSHGAVVGGRRCPRRRHGSAAVARPVGWPVAVFRSDEKPWNLAAVYGDPRREMHQLLAPEMGRLDSRPHEALAAAYAAHLDGDHTESLRLLRAIDTSKLPSPAMTAQLL